MRTIATACSILITKTSEMNFSIKWRHKLKSSRRIQRKPQKFKRSSMLHQKQINRQPPSRLLKISKLIWKKPTLSRVSMMVHPLIRLPFTFPPLLLIFGLTQKITRTLSQKLRKKVSLNFSAEGTPVRRLRSTKSTGTS